MVAAPPFVEKEEDEEACEPTTCVRKAPTGVVWVTGTLNLLLPLSRCRVVALLDVDDDDDVARCVEELPLPMLAVAELLFDDTLDMCPPPLVLNDRFLLREDTGSVYSSWTDGCCIAPAAF